MNQHPVAALRRAATDGHVETLKHLLETWVGIELAVDTDGLQNTCLHLAAKPGHTEVIKLLLDGGANIDAKNVYGETPVYFAVLERRISVVRLLTECGARCDKRCVYEPYFFDDGDHFTLTSSPLQAACILGDTEIVQALMMDSLDEACWSDALFDILELVLLRLNSVRGTNIKRPASYLPLVKALMASKTVSSCLLRRVLDGTLCRNVGGALHTASINGHVDIVEFFLSRTGTRVVARSLLNFGGSRHLVSPLFYAAGGHSLRIIEALLRGGAEIDSEDEEGNTVLHFAASYDADVAKILLGNGAFLNAQNCSGQSPLYLAASNSFYDGARILLEAGADPDIPAKNGTTPLAMAARTGNDDFVRMLMEFGAILEAEFSDYITPIIVAATHGLGSTVALLYEHGARIVADTSQIFEMITTAVLTANVMILLALEEYSDLFDAFYFQGHSMTWWAARSGNTDVLVLLLAWGAAINRPGKNGDVPLQCALQARDINAVATLLREGSDVNQVRVNGFIPLECAAYLGFHEALEMLLTHGAQVNHVSLHNGQTSLYYAIIRDQPECALSLMIAGAPIDPGVICAPLITAATTGSSILTRLLLDNGSFIDSVQDFGNTSLYWAAQRGRRDVTSLLLQRGISCDATDNEGMSALHVAASTGNIAVVKVLVKYGCHLDAQDRYGMSSLGLAVREGKVAITKYLLECGASIDLLDFRGYNLLHYAARCSQTETLAVILQRGGEIKKDTSRISPSISPLSTAAGYGNVETLKMLLNHGTGPANSQQGSQDCPHFNPLIITSAQKGILVTENQSAPCAVRDARIDLALCCAALHGNLEVAGFLLDIGGQVNSIAAKQYRPLTAAVHEEEFEMVELLLHYGAAIDALDPSGGAPLSIAASRNLTDIARLLLEAGAEVDLTNDQGNSVLMCAAFVGAKEMVELFLRFGADVSFQNKMTGETVLHTASQEGHLFIVKAIVNHCRDPRNDWKCEYILRQTNNDESSALLLAATYGHSKVVDFLVRCGMGVDENDGKGQTPLMVAAENGHLSTMELLLNCGASVDEIDDRDITAFFNCLVSGGPAEIIKSCSVMLARSTLINTASKVHAIRAIHIAAFYDRLVNYWRKDNNNDVCDFILKRGAFVDCENASKLTPLCYAALHGDGDTISYFLDAGALIDGLGDALSPLCLAAQNGYSKLIPALLERGTNINYRDKQGRSALFCASQNGHKDTVRLLLYEGACAGIFGRAEMNPAVIAASNGHLDVLHELLRNFGPSHEDFILSLVFAALHRGHIWVANELCQYANLGERIVSALEDENENVEKSMSHMECSRSIAEVKQWLEGSAQCCTLIETII